MPWHSPTQPRPTQNGVRSNFTTRPASWFLSGAALEESHFWLVLLGLPTSVEGAEVSTLARLGVG